MSLQCIRDGSKAIGKWSSEPPTCERKLLYFYTCVNVHKLYIRNTLSAITCDRQTAIPNGTTEYRLHDESESTLTDTDQVPYGTTASYSCDQGLMLTGGNITQTCEVSANNTRVGVWSGTKPNCTGESVH